KPFAMLAAVVQPMNGQNAQVVLRARDTDLGAIDIDRLRTLENLVEWESIQMAKFAVEVDVELLKRGGGADQLLCFWVVLFRNGKVDVAKRAEVVGRVVADGDVAFY